MQNCIKVAVTKYYTILSGKNCMWADKRGPPKQACAPGSRRTIIHPCRKIYMYAPISARLRKKEVHSIPANKFCDTSSLPCDNNQASPVTMETRTFLTYSTQIHFDRLWLWSQWIFHFLFPLFTIWKLQEHGLHQRKGPRPFLCVGSCISGSEYRKSWVHRSVSLTVH